MPDPRPKRTKPSPRTGAPTPSAEPVLGFASADAWSEWLAAHHATSAGVLLEIGKKAGAKKRLSYAEALDAALAWGWIDSHKRRLDDDAWLQRFSPRKPRSAWSKINREKAEALIASGAMKPPGLVEVERAKADGRWAKAYDSSRTSTVPDDLAAALAASPTAAAFFATLDSANRYAILYRVQTAGRAETRTRRIATFVAMLEKHETLHPKRSPRARPASR